VKEVAPVSRVLPQVKPVSQAPLVVLLEQPEKQVRLALLTAPQVKRVTQALLA
jgi:hypothetical protein